MPSDEALTYLELESLYEVAADDASRLGEEVRKLTLDLKCLEESTVDKKAFEQQAQEIQRLKGEADRVNKLIGLALSTLIVSLPKEQSDA